jgi:hypothetical protein
MSDLVPRPPRRLDTARLVEILLTRLPPAKRWLPIAVLAMAYAEHFWLTALALTMYLLGPDD